MLGGDPQDISYRGSDTQVVIGDNNIIRGRVTERNGDRLVIVASRGGDTIAVR